MSSRVNAVPTDLRTPDGVTQTSEFPSGIDRYQMFEQLLQFERDCNFPEIRMGLFGEGPHLTSSAELPWGDEVRELVKASYLRFIHAKTWLTGQGLFKMQDEVVDWLGSLLGAENPSGLITTGGTESNLVSLLAAKSRAQRAGSIVFPAYVHYSIPKACGMFGLEPIQVEAPTAPWDKVPAEHLIAAIREDTIAIVLTAGTFPRGMIDDISEVAEVARARDIYLHVDGCCGGFILPFLERSGYDPDIPPWDFRVPGVCSVSADLHKHGMVPPPASAIVFRTPEIHDYARAISPPHGAITGTRAGGPIAGAWTMTKLLGTAGYCAVAQKSIALRDQLAEGIAEIPHLEVVSGSRINIFAVTSHDRDLYPVWVALRRKGWMLGNSDKPGPTSLVLWALPQNDGMITPLLEDLRRAMEQAGPITKADDERTGKRFYGFDAYGDIFQDVGRETGS